MLRTPRLLPVIAALSAAVALNVSVSSTVTLREDESRRGLVRLDGRALRDDGGVLNPLGATLFWLAWGYKFDRPRLEANLAALADAGVDYVRALGDVGPGSGWADREVNPGWPDYADVIAGATDLAYDRFGLRVQWTIFGGTEHLRTAEARAALVDRMAAIARPRPHKIIAIEIANEGWKNGFEGASGVAELRALGQRLAGATDVLVAPSAPPGGDRALCDLYGGSSADVMTVHYARDRAGPGGGWGPVARPAAPAPSCVRPLPAAVVNNEPVGPGSSNAEERDPLRLALAYVTTFAAGNAAYVLHAAPGVRGGGEGDRALGRAANFRDVPEFDAIGRAMTSAKRYTPAGLANWKPMAGGSAAPLAGVDDAVKRGDLVAGVFATEGQQLFGVLLGLRRDVPLRATAPLAIELIDPVTGAVLMRATVAAGHTIDVRPRPRDGGDGLVVRATRQ